MKIFAERLKELRQERGIGQDKLAVLLGVAKSAISFWENSQRIPSFDNAVKIADFFGVSLDYLAGRKDY